MIRICFQLFFPRFLTRRASIGHPKTDGHSGRYKDRLIRILKSKRSLYFRSKPFFFSGKHCILAHPMNNLPLSNGDYMPDQTGMIIYSYGGP